MTNTDSNILRPGQKDNLPTTAMILRLQNQIMNAQPEAIYRALSFLYDLRGDRLATSDEYQKFLRDSSYAREMLYGLSNEAGSVELLYGFFSGEKVDYDDPHLYRGGLDFSNPEVYAEPDIDDSVKACPECETPNQFGEVCARCRREIDEEREARERGEY